MEKNINLIRKIVWNFIKTTPRLEFDDLFSEAYLAYLEAIPFYNAEKGQESTFIYHVVTNQLKTLIKRQSVEIIGFNDLQEEIEDFNPSPELSFLIIEDWALLFNALSPKAREICEIVLDDKENTELMGTPKKYRGKLVRNLKEQGWSWADIWGTFSELKAALSSS